MSGDVAADVRDIVADDRSAAAAEDARRYVMAHHTYDHRVDELLAIAEATSVTAPRPQPSFASELAQRIDQDVEVQTILDLSSVGLASDLASREVRPGELYRGRIGEGSVDAVAIGPDHLSAAGEAAMAARSFIYFDRVPHDVVDKIVAYHPHASVQQSGTVVRVDLLEGRYRQRSTEHPLA
jgi:hypothetical protein